MVDGVVIYIYFLCIDVRTSRSVCVQRAVWFVCGMLCTWVSWNYYFPMRRLNSLGLSLKKGDTADLTQSPSSKVSMATRLGAPSNNKTEIVHICGLG